MNNLQIAAQMMLDTFETKKRDTGESFVCMNGSETEWVENIAFEAHMEAFPNDFAYDVLHSIVAMIAESEEDEHNERLYDLPSCYTYELAKITNQYSKYIDQALEENQQRTYFDLLVNANAYMYDEVYHIVLSGLTAVIEDAGFSIDDDDMKAEDLE